MEYLVVTNGEAQMFAIGNHRPEGSIAPRTEGWMRYIPGTGFEVTLRCYETNPKAVHTQPDDPVCKDSCMEVFLNCFPEFPEYGYINVEMNSAGNMRCGFGTDRHNRYLVREKGFAQPERKVSFGEDYWQVQCLLTEELLEKLYARPCRFTSGHEMRGNFYKCGDETDSPHWGSWSRVERLDFHTPEFFGLIKIQ